MRLAFTSLSGGPVISGAARSTPPNLCQFTARTRRWRNLPLNNNNITSPTPSSIPSSPGAHRPNHDNNNYNTTRSGGLFYASTRASDSAAGSEDVKDAAAGSSSQRAGLLPLLLRRIQYLSSKVSPIGVAFVIMTYICAIVLIIPMAIAHPFVLLFDHRGRRFHDYIATAWFRASLACAMIRDTVVRPELIPPNDVPAVYVANHASYIDIYAMAFVRRRLKFVSKAEIFRMPIVGWAMAMAGNVALVRASKKGQINAYRNMMAILNAGISLVVFPEGTRSPTGKLQRFHAGAFRAAKSAGVPVVPITIDGTRQMMPYDALLPIRFPWNGIKLTIHHPITSHDKSVEQLKNLAFKSIDSALDPDLQSSQHL